MQRIKTSQALTMPSFTVKKAEGIEWIYFNYADKQKVDLNAQVEDLSEPSETKKRVVESLANDDDSSDLGPVYDPAEVDGGYSENDQNDDY